MTVVCKSVVCKSEWAPGAPARPVDAIDICCASARRFTSFFVVVGLTDRDHYDGVLLWVGSNPAFLSRYCSRS